MLLWCSSVHTAKIIACLLCHCFRLNVIIEAQCKTGCPPKPSSGIIFFLPSLISGPISKQIFQHHGRSEFNFIAFGCLRINFWL